MFNASPKIINLFLIIRNTVNRINYYKDVGSPAILFFLSVTGNTFFKIVIQFQGCSHKQELVSKVTRNKKRQ